MLVARGDQRRRIEIAFPLCGLLCQDVTLVGLRALELAGSRGAEALGGSAVRFHLGHRITSSVACRRSASRGRILPV